MHLYEIFYRAPNENLQFGVVESSRTININAGDQVRKDLAEVIATGSNKSMYYLKFHFISYDWPVY